MIDITEYLAGSGEPVIWNLPMDHLSPSSLSMLRRCPYQFQQRYLRGLKERPNEAPVIGTTVHAGIERNFHQKIESHEDMSVTTLLDWYASEAFPLIVLEEQEKAGEEVRWDTSPDEARMRGYTMLAAYHNAVAPRIQPLGAEGKISVDLGAPVPIIGRYDVLREESVIDVKTGKAKQSKPKEDWRIQAAVYGEATGRPVEFHSVTATVKTNTVSIVTPLESEHLLVQPTLLERAEMRRTIRAVAAEACFYMALLGPDEDWPTHGRFHVWACDFCGYRPKCPAWQN